MCNNNVACSHRCCRNNWREETTYGWTCLWFCLWESSSVSQTEGKWWWHLRSTLRSKRRVRGRPAAAHSATSAWFCRRSDDGRPVPRGPAHRRMMLLLLLLGWAALGSKVHLQKVRLLIVLSSAGLSSFLLASSSAWRCPPSPAQAQLGGRHHGQAEGAEAHAGSARVKGGAIVLRDVYQQT